MKRKINEFYREDGTPIMCHHCGHEKFKDRVIDRIDAYGPISEFEEICVNCGKIVAYWAYGSYDPRFENELINKIHSNALNTIGSFIGGEVWLYDRKLFVDRHDQFLWDKRILGADKNNAGVAENA